MSLTKQTKTNGSEEKYLSIADAADVLGVSTKTLRRWETAGKLVAARSKGGHRQYHLYDLVSLKNSHSTKSENKNQLTVEKAAEALDVSTKTLRRWETQGTLTPKRTSGGHRRYSLGQIKDFKKRSYQARASRENLQASPKTAFPTSQAQLPLDFDTFRSYSVLNPDSLHLITSEVKRPLMIAFAIVASLALLSLSMKLAPRFEGTQLGQKITTDLYQSASRSTPSSSPLASQFTTHPQELESRVLQAESVNEDVIFAINIPTNLRALATFEQGQTTTGLATFENIEASGDLAVNGGDITTT